MKILFIVVNALILIVVPGLIAVLTSLQSSAEVTEQQSKAVLGPGDYKKGYESVDYKTHSLDLQKRIGKEANLLEFVTNPPLGLPVVPVPKDNPITAEKVALGEKPFVYASGITVGAYERLG